MIRLDFAAIKEKPSPKVIAAIRNFIDKIGEYPDESYIRLRSKLAEILKIDSGQIVLGNGCDEVIDVVSRAFLKPDDKVLIPVPTFSQFELAAGRIGATPVMVNCMRDAEYEIDNSKVAAQNDKCRLIWVCSPNNPTGTKIPLSVIEGIAAKKS